MFNREFRRNINLSIEVNYTSNDFLIKKITILKKDLPRQNFLSIECVDTSEGKALADQIAIATQVVKIWEGDAAEEKALRRHRIKFYTKYTDTDECKRLINVLHSTLYNDAPIIDADMHDQLLGDMDIKVYCEDIHAMILAEADINI